MSPRRGAVGPAGIHYVGQMHEGSMLRVALDQLTDGQLCWHRLPDPYDEVVLGSRRYQLRAGKATFAAALEEQFPAEKEAIREFMKISKVERHSATGGGISPGILQAWTGQTGTWAWGMRAVALVGVGVEGTWVVGMVGKG